jgi:hypothetical protein
MNLLLRILSYIEFMILMEMHNVISERQYLYVTGYGFESYYS